MSVQEIWTIVMPTPNVSTLKVLSRAPVTLDTMEQEQPVQVRKIIIHIHLVPWRNAIPENVDVVILS